MMNDEKERRRPKMNAQPLSNVQLELLKLYSTNLSQEDLLDIKRLLARYFAQKAINGADKIWEEKGLSNRRERKPSHPGELIREDLLVEAGLSQNKLAQLIGVSRKTVSDIVNECRRVTPDLALRLARVFNSTPEMWLNMQQAVDLWEARNIHKREYERIHPLHEPLAARELHPA